MSAPLSEQQLAEIRARAEAATEGPWARADFGHAGEQEPSSTVVHTGAFNWNDLNSPEGTSAVAWMAAWDSQADDNAAFIAAARTDVPALLAEVDRLRTERDAYADRVDTLTSVAKGNKRNVQETYGDLLAAQARITVLEQQLTAGPYVWQVWEEDGPLYGVYASRADAEGGTIDCYRDMGESCPDYSWRWEAGGTQGELLAGDEPVGIWLARHQVRGTATPTGPRDGDQAHIAALEGFANLATEYRVPIEGDSPEWLLVRREPYGDGWAILTSHRVSGKRRAWVGGRWQTMPVVGPVGLFEYATAEAAICQATALAKASEGGGSR